MVFHLPAKTIILSRDSVEFISTQNSLNVSVPGASIKMENENFPTNDG